MAEDPKFTAESLREELDILWRQLDYMRSADEHMMAANQYREQAQAAERNVNFLRTELQTTIKQLYEETTKYLNAVAVVGYAAYFASWSFTRDLMPREVSSFVGLAGMISVSAFVLWEMWVAFSIRLKGVNEASHILREMRSAEDFERLKGELLAREAWRMAIATPAHRFVFATSSLAAIAGGLVMMHALYASL